MTFVDIHYHGNTHAHGLNMDCTYKRGICRRRDSCSESQGTSSVSFLLNFFKKAVDRIEVAKLIANVRNLQGTSGSTYYHGLFWDMNLKFIINVISNMNVISNIMQSMNGKLGI